MSRVLFVCLGNICRSPAAEGIFLKKLSDSPLKNKLIVDSAGTGGWHEGEAPDSRMIFHAGQRGYDLSQLEARQFTREDFDRFDFIITMDNSNYQNVLRLDPDLKHAHKVKKMVQFCKIHDVPEVPDPYPQGPDGFEHVLDILEDGCTQLLEMLEEELT